MTNNALKKMSNYAKKTLINVKKILGNVNKMLIKHQGKIIPNKTVKVQ
jgi:hypothetical protein